MSLFLGMAPRDRLGTGGDALGAPCDELGADLDLGDALESGLSPLSLSWLDFGRSSGVLYRMSVDLKVPSDTCLAPSLAVLLEAMHVAPSVELLCSFLAMMTSLASPA